MAKQVCVKAGETAGNVVRTTANATKGLVGGCSVICETISTVAKSTYQMTKEVCAKLGNLFHHVRKDSQIAVLETKQKEIFSKLGQEVFSSVESGVTNIVEDEKAKELLKSAVNCEKEIQNVKDEIELQQQKMEEIAILKRVKNELQSEDPRIRRVAIRVLERVESKEAVSILSQCLSDPDIEVKTRAADVMRKLVDKMEKSNVVPGISQGEEQKKQENAGQTSQP